MFLLLYVYNVIIHAVVASYLFGCKQPLLLLVNFILREMYSSQIQARQIAQEQFSLKLS